jgi:DNA integrity scanning protein DisA with diadenylate cyclase activity
MKRLFPNKVILIERNSHAKCRRMWLQKYSQNRTTSKAITLETNNKELIPPKRQVKPDRSSSSRTSTPTQRTEAQRVALKAEVVVIILRAATEYIKFDKLKHGLNRPCFFNI